MDQTGTEFLSKKEIEHLQLSRLKEQLKYVETHSAYYKNVFSSVHFNPSALNAISDLKKIPVTTKEDLNKWNKDFLSVSSEMIVDHITTSGTLGDPVSFAMTDKDLDRLADNEVFSFKCAGLDQNDTIQLMTTMDRRFMAGLAYFLGSRKLGSAIIRVGNGIPELQWDTIQRMKPTAVIAVPSFLLRIIDYAEDNGIDLSKTSIEKAICIGEPIRNLDFSMNSLGNRIVDKWPIKLFSTYASTEMSTAFTECSLGCGGHHNPELIVVEFLDEENQEVPEGEAGEVTITHLGVEGMPLVRFKTGDLAIKITDPCACGRNSFRISPVVGRKKQMIKFKGTTLYPPAFYELLNEIDDVQNYIVEITKNDIDTDEITIYIGSEKKDVEFEKALKDHFRAKLRVAPNIIFKNAEEITKLQFGEKNRKPVTFIDKR